MSFYRYDVFQSFRTRQSFKLEFQVKNFRIFDTKETSHYLYLIRFKCSNTPGSEAPNVSDILGSEAPNLSDTLGSEAPNPSNTLGSEAPTHSITK